MSLRTSTAYMPDWRFLGQLDKQKQLEIAWFKHFHDHVYYLTKDGRLFVIDQEGNRSHLGLQANKDKLVESHEITELCGKQVVDIVRSSSHCLARTKAGEVFAWGCNRHGQLGDGSRLYSAKPIRVVEQDVVQIACGKHNSLALTSQGALLYWGLNSQLKSGRRLKCIQLPTRMESLSSHVVVQIASGLDHFMVRTETGRAFTWGCNKHRQLAIQTTRTRVLTPTEVILPQRKKESFIWITCAHRQSLLLTQSYRLLSTNLGRGLFTSIHLAHFKPAQVYVLNMPESLKNDKCWYACFSKQKDTMIWPFTQSDHENIQEELEAVTKAKQCKRAYFDHPMPLADAINKIIPYFHAPLAVFTDETFAIRKLRGPKTFNAPWFETKEDRIQKQLNYRFNDRSTADVCFRFSNDSRVIYAHRSYLTNKLGEDKTSKLWENGEKSEKTNKMCIRDWRKQPYEVVYRLVRYLYTGHVKLKALEMEYLLRLALQAFSFDLDALLAQIGLYLKANTEHDLLDRSVVEELTSGIDNFICPHSNAFSLKFTATLTLALSYRDKNVD